MSRLLAAPRIWVALFVCISILMLESCTATAVDSAPVREQALLTPTTPVREQALLTPTSAVPVPTELAVYEGCITCHNQHAPTVVAMPHPSHPTCKTCHSGSPRRIGCPTCHSTHSIKSPHGNDPALACGTCHK